MVTDPTSTASLLNTGAAASGASAASSAAARLSQEKNPPKSQIDGKKIADDFSQFLLLLTTQLKNQDPTEPLDTNEFTAQLVQFAGVEQQLATNANLEKMINLAQQSRIESGVAYIGRAVDAEGNAGFLAGGRAAFVYELPSNVKEARVTIMNSANQVVFSGTGAVTQGKNLVSWDGIGNVGAANGRQLPDGAYFIAVKATGFDGKEVTGTKTYTTGRVSAANFDEDGNLNLEVGTISIPAERILAVREIPNF
jgi:flagellar basal-body rod modification protein FlgD